MPRNGTKNLKPCQSKEEAKERGRLGGIKSGEVRRERKTIREELLALLSVGDTQQKMSTAMIDKALCGDVKAFEAIRDTIGEKPVDKVMVADIDASVISDVENMVKGVKSPIAKTIICKDKATGEIIKTYLSIKDAAEDLDLFAGNISKCLAGKTKSCGGYCWEYAK